MSETVAPEDCTTMTEVRAGVDAVDRAVVALLKRRFGYMNAAARIKPDRSAVRDEARKADVLAKVRAAADRKSTRLNSSHTDISRMPSSA